MSFSEYYQKNKTLIICAVVLGGGLLFVWRSGFSISKQLSQYVPGQQQQEAPVKPPSMQPAPYVPQKQVNENHWRSQFEADRMREWF